MAIYRKGDDQFGLREAAAEAGNLQLSSNDTEYEPHRGEWDEHIPNRLGAKSHNLGYTEAINQTRNYQTISGLEKKYAETGKATPISGDDMKKGAGTAKWGAKSIAESAYGSGVIKGGKYVKGRKPEK